MNDVASTCGKVPNQAQVENALVDLLPRMVVDGGGAAIITVADGVARVALQGSCLLCPSRQRSAKALSDGLRARMPNLRDVIVIAGNEVVSGK